mgnify:CR=1 FL=1
MPYFVDNPIFDTTNAHSALGEDCRPPPVLDYFERILRFAVDQDFGSGA